MVEKMAAWFLSFDGAHREYTKVPLSKGNPFAPPDYSDEGESRMRGGRRATSTTPGT
jgi:hypothetical protein